MSERNSLEEFLARQTPDPHALDLMDEAVIIMDEAAEAELRRLQAEGIVVDSRDDEAMNTLIRWIADRAEDRLIRRMLTMTDAERAERERRVDDLMSNRRHGAPASE